MSWIDKIQNDLIIITADGREFRPGWVDAVKSKEYNISEFDFKGVSGTLVHRELPRGRRYELNLYFQGHDHLEQAQAFEDSADVPGVWSLTHPFYGSIKVQPLSFAQDNTDLNLSKILVPVLETIDLENEDIVTNTIPEEVKAVSEEKMELLVKNYGELEPVIVSSVKSEIKRNALQKYKTIAVQIKNTADSSRFTNAFNNLANTLIQPGAASVDIARSLQRISTLPYQFIDSAYNRIRMLGLQYQIIKNNINNLGKRTSKRTFETDGAGMIFGMAISGVEYVSDNLSTMSEIIALADIIHGFYDDFIAKLDDLMTDTGSNIESYIPDYDILMSLSRTVDKTLIYLFDLAKNGLQERTLILAEDTNIYELTNKLYGMDDNDENLRKLITLNSIGLSELITLAKGRVIKYFK